MSDILLFPRLHQLGVRRVEDSLNQLAAGTIASRTELFSDFISYTASGGMRASAQRVLELRDQLIELAQIAGFPDRGTSATRASFDAVCGAWLVEHGPIMGGEALRDDIWAYLCCCVVPDICLWRFEGANPARFRGGIRNTFQRLWLRAAVLDRGDGTEGRWKLLEELSEDALVQITERPSIGADAYVASGIAEAWSTTASRIGTSRMEPVTRNAVRRIRIANETICFAAMEKHDLLTRFALYFADAADRVG